MTCSFCGTVFEEAGSRHECRECVFAAGCRSVRCPKCHYEAPEVDGWLKKISEWGEKMAKKWRGEPAVWDANRRIGGVPVVSLAEMGQGASGVVVDLVAGNDGQAGKCLSLGILPGTRITLLKRSPSFIFSIGYSQFAVDEGMAGVILVQPRQ